VSTPERLTVDATVARDYIHPARPRHALAVELFARARRGEVELATAPQGYRLDVSGDLAQQLRETFDREQVRPTRQVARVSTATYPGPDLIVGHYVEGFVETWEQIAAGWSKAPGPADRLHVETHLAEGRDVFITDDGPLLTMCQRLRDLGFSIDALTLRDYLDRRDADAGV
jgi:hypothetical protein